MYVSYEQQIIAYNTYLLIYLFSKYKHEVSVLQTIRKQVQRMQANKRCGDLTSFCVNIKCQTPFCGFLYDMSETERHVFDSNNLRQAEPTGLRRQKMACWLRRLSALQ